MDHADFDETVTGFYRAAAGTIDWIDALQTFQRSISAFAIYVHSTDATSGRVAYSYNASDLPVEAELDYIRTYHRIDPRARLGMGMMPGEWVNCWDVFDDDFVANDRFYQDFLIPYGGRYVSGGKLIEDDSECVILGVHRGIGSAKLNANEIDTCRRLARHLTGALQVHRARATRDHEGLLGSALLAKLRAPVALIDDERRILHLNPSAERLLAECDALFVQGERLHCRRGSEDARLLIALRQLLWEDSSRHGGPPVDRIYLRTHAGGTGKEVGLALNALRPPQTLQAFGDRPLAMVLFHEARNRLQLDPFVIGDAFGLTPGEARVAVAIAKGNSPDEIAVRHGISVHTVRSQLKDVFSKTGALRQSDLVSLLAELPSMVLANPPR